MNAADRAEQVDAILDLIVEVAKKAREECIIVYNYAGPATQIYALASALMSLDLKNANHNP